MKTVKFTFQKKNQKNAEPLTPTVYFSHFSDLVILITLDTENSSSDLSYRAIIQGYTKSLIIAQTNYFHVTKNINFNQINFIIYGLIIQIIYK